MHDVVAVAVSVGRMRRKTCTALPPAKVGAVGAVVVVVVVMVAVLVSAEVVSSAVAAMAVVMEVAVVVSSFNDKLLTAINAASVKSREFLILSKESRLFLGAIVVGFEEGLFDGDANVNAAMVSSRVDVVAGLESRVVESGSGNGSDGLLKGDARVVGAGEDIVVLDAERWKDFNWAMNF